MLTGSGWDVVIRECDLAIDELETSLAALRKIREAALSLTIPSVKRSEKWYAPSRSGNSYGHTMTGRDGEYACSCPAGTNGRECWALRGLRKYRPSILGPVSTTSITFRDEQYNERVLHFWGWV